MPAYLYRRTQRNGRSFLSQVKKISLAGNGPIYRLWHNAGQPMNRGWHISSRDLIDYINLADPKSAGFFEIVIDAAPSLRSVVNLVNLTDIYLFTHGNQQSGVAQSSNLMLLVKDAYWKEQASNKEKAQLTREFEEPHQYGDDIFTFLYLRDSWNWGRLGQMNGAWIHRNARNYFKTRFC